jgi:LemA protein
VADNEYCSLLIFCKFEIKLNLKKMKRGCVIGLVIAAVLAIIFFIIFGYVTRSYNKMVTMSEAVSKEWSNVETQYQRRADLIPNFVNTVKGAANFEQETLTKVIEARAKATGITIDPKNLDQAALDKFQAAQGEISSTLSRLMVVVEKYPELKATQNYRDLQVELEGTENRIAVARNNFNETARTYNTFIKSFPMNIIAGFTSFSEKPYFKAAEGTDKAPQVQF